MTQDFLALENEEMQIIKDGFQDSPGDRFYNTLKYINDRMGGLYTDAEIAVLITSQTGSDEWMSYGLSPGTAVSIATEVMGNRESKLLSELDVTHSLYF